MTSEQLPRQVPVSFAQVNVHPVLSGSNQASAEAEKKAKKAKENGEKEARKWQKAYSPKVTDIQAGGPQRTHFKAMRFGSSIRRTRTQ